MRYLAFQRSDLHLHVFNFTDYVHKKFIILSLTLLHCLLRSMTRARCACSVEIP